MRVEPVLLRALRRALGLPVQAEIEVWSHADVATHGAMACTLKAECLAHYRDQARQLPAALGRRLAALIAEHHRHLSPLILNEEAALAFDLVGPSPVQAGDEDDPGDWRRVASTLYQGSPLSPELAAMSSGRAGVRMPACGEACRRWLRPGCWRTKPLSRTVRVCRPVCRPGWCHRWLAPGQAP